jgi:outer membrane lipoprotein carrier protein
MNPRARGRVEGRVTTLALILVALLAAGPLRAEPAPTGGSAPAEPAPADAPAPAPAGPGAATEAPDAGSGACAEAVVERVQARYDAVRDLRARFEQHTRSVAFVGSAVDEPPARGEVVLAKPGRMRWSYEEPAESLVVSDGETLWIYDPVAGEAQALAVDEGFLSGAALQFLLGEGRIAEAFEVTARGCSGPEVRLELRPREPQTYERLELVVDAGSGLVRSTAVDDLFGNRTEVRFTDLAFNEGPAAETFRFEPPEGVRVETLPGPQ